MATQQQQITVKDLLDSGAHFGHQTDKWNPKMKRFIFEERNGIYIIDLAKTMQQIRDAREIVKEAALDRKPILFVGTKKQAKNTIRECAEMCGEFYVCERWPGGALTNHHTIRKSIKTLENVEKKLTTGADEYTKKELSLLAKQKAKLDRNLSGIRAMRKLPGLLIVVDSYREHIAVKEAKKLGIPIMALVDTNCDPDPIDHIIACNDDALKSIKLILQDLSNVIKETKDKLYASKAKEAAAAEQLKAEESKKAAAEEEEKREEK